MNRILSFRYNACPGQNNKIIPDKYGNMAILGNRKYQYKQRLAKTSNDNIPDKKNTGLYNGVCLST